MLFHSGLGWGWCAESWAEWQTVSGRVVSCGVVSTSTLAGGCECRCVCLSEDAEGRKEKRRAWLWRSSLRHLESGFQWAGGRRERPGVSLSRDRAFRSSLSLSLHPGHPVSQNEESFKSTHCARVVLGDAARPTFATTDRPTHTPPYPNSRLRGPSRETDPPSSGQAGKQASRGQTRCRPRAATALMSMLASCTAPAPAPARTKMKPRAALLPRMDLRWQLKAVQRLPIPMTKVRAARSKGVRERETAWACGRAGGGPWDRKEAGKDMIQCRQRAEWDDYRSRAEGYPGHQRLKALPVARHPDSL